MHCSFTDVVFLYLGEQSLQCGVRRGLLLAALPGHGLLVHQVSFWLPSLVMFYLYIRYPSDCPPWLWYTFTSGTPVHVIVQPSIVMVYLYIR
jgi:hypothetical protein